MSDKLKKSRSANFSKEEELLLADEVFKEKTIIECKMSNKTANLEKEQAWERIQHSFNSKCFVRRSIEQLKSKYDNLKTKVRKIVANKRKSVFGTNDDPSYDAFDPIVEAILKILNSKIVEGQQNSFDGDSCIDDSTTNITQSSQNCVIDCKPFPMLAIDNTTPDVKPSILFTSDLSEDEILQESSAGRTTPFTSDLSEDLIIHESSIERTTPNANFKCSLDTNSSHYISRKLKKPVSKKLRATVPTALGQVKEEYYKLKIEFLKVELEEQRNRAVLLKKELELKEMEYAKKEERETQEEKRRDEEHKRKMRLLDLEILKQERDFKKI